MKKYEVEISETALDKLHFFPVDSYLVFYIIDERAVTVTDVLYSASDVKVHLKDRHT